MVFDVATAMPIVAAVGGQSVFDTVVNSVIDNGPLIAQRFVTGCYMILTVTVGIRLAKALMEAVYDDSIVSGVADAINVVVTGLILLMALTHIPDISSLVWAVVDETMAVMDISGSNGGAKGIATNMMNTTWSVVPQIFGIFFAQDETADPSLWEKVTGFLGEMLTGAAALHLMLGLLCILMALIYAVIVSVQIAVGLMQITIGIVFLPVTLAFYPVIESWAKNALATIAAGIAHMGICAFLISIVGKMASDMTTQVANGGFTAFGYEMGFDAVGANKTVALLALGGFLLVLGLSTGKAVGFATSIFGSVSGMIGRTAARGGVGGGSKAAGAAGKGAGAAVEQGAKAAAGAATTGGAKAAAAAAATAGTGGLAAPAAAAATAASTAMQAGTSAATKAATGGKTGMEAAGVSPSGALGSGGGESNSSASQGSGTSAGAGGRGAGSNGGAGKAGGPTASMGEKAGMAAALLGAAAKNAGAKAAASPAGQAVRKAGGAAVSKAGAGAMSAAKWAGGKAMSGVKAAPRAAMKAQLRSTING